MPVLKTRPRYRFCWWCSNKLRGNQHMIMRASAEAASGAANVIAHAACAEEMEREEGWEVVSDDHIAVMPQSEGLVP